MRSANSLTEAVKAAASQTGSLTDAVKAAARSTSEANVVDFPGQGYAPRHDAPRAFRLIRPEPPADAGGGLPQATSAPVGETGIEAPLQAGGAYRQRLSALAPYRSRLLRRAGRSRRRLAGHARRVASWPLRQMRRVLPSRTALREAACAAKRAVRRAAIRAGSVLALGFAALAVTPSPVGSDRPLAVALEKRVALVVGNSDYRHARRLGNPRNDAMDVGAALGKLGFRVIVGLDLDKPGLEAKIRAFTAALSGADVGVFFYAGHGVHVSGQNYLVPVDARLTAASAPDQELVRLDLVHRTMEREARTAILFFDACRDNPLSDNLARTMGTRSAQFGRGLAVVQGGAGTLISFSTQPGTVALDGKGRNSPYSSALVKQLVTSHEDLNSMMIAVRNEVMKETNYRQVPWEHSALTGKFYFTPPAGAARAAPPAEAPEDAREDVREDVRAREAFDAWNAAKDTRSLAVLDAFVSHYGDTFYAELARARMAELRRRARSFE